MEYLQPSFRFKPGPLSWESAAALNTLIELVGRSQRWSFDPSQFEYVQTDGNQSVRLAQTDCCCEYVPTEVIENADITGNAYSFSNRETQAVIFANTTTTRVTANLPAVADLPAIQDCYYLVIVNSGSACIRVTPQSTTLIDGAAHLDVWPKTTVRVWLDQETIPGYRTERGHYSYTPLAYTDSQTLDETSFGRVVTFTASTAKTATIGAAAINSGSGQYIVNRGTHTVTVTPASGTIDGASSKALFPGQGVLVASDGTNQIMVAGRYVAGINVQTGDYTILPGDHGKIIQCSGTVDQAITLPQMGDGFWVHVNCSGGTYHTVTVTDAAGQAYRLANDTGATWFSDGTTTTTNQPGQMRLGTIQYTTDQTLKWAHHAKHISYAITAADRTLTLGSGTLVSGFGVWISNDYSSTKWLTVTLASGTWRHGSDLKLAAGSSVYITCDGTYYTIEQGTYVAGVNAQTGTAYTTTAADHRRLIHASGSSDLAITSGTAIPAGVWEHINNAGALKDVSWTDEAGNVFYIAQDCGISIFHDGTTTATINPGQMRLGHIAYTTDQTLKWAHHGRHLNWVITSADRTVTLGATTKRAGFGVWVTNDHTSTKWLNVTLASGTWSNGTDLKLAAGSGVYITCDGSVYSIDAGTYSANTKTEAGTSITSAADWHRATILCTATSDVAVTIAADSPSNIWFTISNVVTSGTYKTVTITHATSGTSFRVAANCTVTVVTGLTSDLYTVHTGQMRMPGANNTADKTLSWAHLGTSQLWTLGAANRTVTLDASTRVDGWGCWIGNSSSTTNARTLTISPAAGSILGIDSAILKRCRGVYISCDGTNYIAQPGYVCCDCGVAVTYTHSGTTTYSEITEHFYDSDDGFLLTPGTNTMTYELAPAGTRSIGGVTNAAQTIQGTKTFNDSIRVDVTLTAFIVGATIAGPGFTYGPTTLGNRGKFNFIGDPGAGDEAELVLDGYTGATGDLLDGDGNTVLQFYGGIVRTISGPIGGGGSASGILLNQSMGF